MDKYIKFSFNWNLEKLYDSRKHCIIRFHNITCTNTRINIHILSIDETSLNFSNISFKLLNIHLIMHNFKKNWNCKSYVTMMCVCTSYALMTCVSFKNIHILVNIQIFTLGAKEYSWTKQCIILLCGKMSQKHGKNGF